MLYGEATTRLSSALSSDRRAFDKLPAANAWLELAAGKLHCLPDKAESMKEISQRAIKKVSARSGKTIILFYAPSTQTRSSFDIVAKHAGGCRDDTD
jgi:hypothetical protein